MANREIFGPEKDNQEMEEAYQMSSLITTLGTGVIDEKDYLIVVPEGKKPKVTVHISGQKNAEVVTGQVEVFLLNPEQKTKINVGPFSWSGMGKSKLIVKL